MKSNYKRLGPYIRPVDVRNKGLEITKLLGISVEKKFIPSIANIIGTDLEKYKIVRTGQFGYIPDTSRRGNKIAVALLTESNCIISNAYTVFEIIDTNELDPEYLMLWFNRPEFDRYARYHSHGSVREIFDWEAVCNVELPVPDIEVQRGIVNSQKALSAHISFYQKEIEKCEAILLALYRNLRKGEHGWQIKTLGEVCDTVGGGTPSTDCPEYYKNGNIPWVTPTAYLS